MVNLKQKASILLFFVICLSFGIYYYIFYTFQFQNLREIQDQYFTKVQNSFYKNQELHLKQRYLQEIQTLLNEMVIKNFALQKRDDLIKSLLPVFNKKKQNDPYLELMHFHLKDGTSFLRLPRIDNFGDDLSHIRTIITQVHKDHSVNSGFESGIYGLTYRIVVPVFYQKEYIGAVEMGISPKKILDHVSYFNEAKGLIKFSNDKSSLLFETIEDNKLLQFILKNKPDQNNSRKHIKYNDKYLGIYSFNVYTFDNQKIGEFIFIKDLSLYFNRFHGHLLKLFINFLISTFILYIILEYIFRRYTKEIFNQYEKTNSILENQQNIVILTNGAKIFQANKKFFEFTGYENLKAFLTEYNCICDLFEKEDGFLQPIKGELVWTKYVINSPQKIHLAKIKKKGKTYIFKVLVAKIDEKNQEDTNLIVTLVDITKELELQNKIKQKDLLIQQQSKIMAVADILGNISYQWKQPLSTISTAISGLSLKEEYGILEVNDISNTNKIILKNVKLLSTTLDNFKDFFKTDRTKKTFLIKDTIKSTLSIIKASFDNNLIIVEETYGENISYYGNESLLSQVLLYILSNAKDALSSKNIQKKIVWISLLYENNEIKIIIKDNAGGIDENIKEKIFDQYFTTKKNNQSAGLGLYISKEIITKYFQGTLDIENSTDIKGQGASFIIRFKQVKL